MTYKSCRDCGHSDLFLRRSDKRCGFSIQGSKAGPCLCSCVYGDTTVIVRVREVGQYLLRETDGGAILTRDRAKAARLTLDGARWFNERCPFAVDIEVLR